MARSGGGRKRFCGGGEGEEGEGDSRISDGKRRQQGMMIERERETDGERKRGGREIRLTQRENENEGRDVSTIDHRGSECNANHAPFARTHPLTPAAAPTPDAAHPSRRRFSLLPLSHPSALPLVGKPASLL